MTTHKIVPINGRFTNLKAFLHHIAEDEEFVGVVGCVLKKNGNVVPFMLNAQPPQISYAAAILLQQCLDHEGAEETEGAA